MGCYSLISSILLFHHVKAKCDEADYYILSTFIGMAFFGLGTIFWFWYDTFLGVEVPFPSISDFFYMMQFPFSLFGLLSLSIDNSAPEEVILDKKVQIVVLNVIIVVCTHLLSIVLSLLTVGLSVETFLLMYFPIESFFLLVYALALYLKRISVWRQAFLKKFVFVILGDLSWLFADCIFFYQIMTDKFFSGSYADLLFLTGVFLVLFGYTGMAETLMTAHAEVVDRIYYEKISYSRPTSLNSTQ